MAEHAAVGVPFGGPILIEESYWGSCFFVESLDLYLAGFPDSDLANYDLAAATPKRVLMWGERTLVVGGAGCPGEGLGAHWVPIALTPAQ
ncbi:hypothetical protein MSAR_46730 [Mycolicibacterium sarraceniae]|uniref:Uncharacterized protein n=1 Tax=Mycolicibacterium sarraceniae TaxID=1534348 RepID=A0A7I7SX03_9MYCO|nr:hypothetical protein MSAR_46730 [Mycolicibacterium sarraceniae]